MNNKKVYLNNDIHNNPGPTLVKLAGGATSLVIAAIIVDDQVIGMVEAGAFNPGMKMMCAFLLQWQKLPRMQSRELLSEQKEGQLHRLNTLREIDRMITGNFDSHNIMAFCSIRSSVRRM